jgi:hypothetical protein
MKQLLKRLKRRKLQFSKRDQKRARKALIKDGQFSDGIEQHPPGVPHRIVRQRQADGPLD